MGVQQRIERRIGARAKDRIQMHTRYSKGYTQRIHMQQRILVDRRDR